MTSETCQGWKSSSSLRCLTEIAIRVDVACAYFLLQHIHEASLPVDNSCLGSILIYSKEIRIFRRFIFLILTYIRYPKEYFCRKYFYFLHWIDSKIKYNCLYNKNQKLRLLRCVSPWKWRAICLLRLDYCYKKNFTSSIKCRVWKCESSIFFCCGLSSPHQELYGK